MKEIQKHSHLRKRVQMQKCINLFSTNKYVLFFHYNGASASNWQQIKDQLRSGGVCKSLLVQSKNQDHSPLFPALLSGQRSTGILQQVPSVVAGWTQIGRVDRQATGELPKLSTPRGCLTGATSAQSGVENLGASVQDSPCRESGGASLMEHLFQGPTLLVACSSAEQFHDVIKKCVSPHFVCIGGVYEKTPLTHLDIQRCIQLHGHGEQVYHALLKPLTQWHSFLHLLQNQMNWHFLKFHQKKMVALLEEYHRSASAPAKELVTESRP